jgi:two-component sensor histidine kinase
MASTMESAADQTPEQAENRLLWERCRIGAVVVMAGIAFVFVGEIVLRPGRRPVLGIAQAVNFAILGACVLACRDPSRRTWNSVLCFIGFTATAVAIGVAGIVARDPTSALVVLVGLAMGAAVLVPWGAHYQLPGIAVTTAVAIWTLTSIYPDSRDSWLQPVGSVLPTFLASVIVAYLLRRQRQAIAEAEWERRARERGLREANRRLEIEIRDHQDTEKALRFAVLELDHRVKNTLASLQSIAEQTLATSSSAEEFAEGFRGRIRAMARIHSALATRRWEAINVAELIALVVGPYEVHVGSIVCRCDEVWVSSAEARALGTALHELATNAAKYGALSTKEGRVDVVCNVLNASGARLRVVWSEAGGPTVRQPQRRGLGTKLIEAALAYESGGTVLLDFGESGVRCEIDMPLSGGGEPAKGG